MNITAMNSVSLDPKDAEGNRTQGIALTGFNHCICDVKAKRMPQSSYLIDGLRVNAMPKPYAKLGVGLQYGSSRL